MYTRSEKNELLNDEKYAKHKIRIRDNFEVKEHAEFMQKRRKTFWVMFAIFLFIDFILMWKVITTGSNIAGGALETYNKGILQSWQDYFSSWQNISLGYPGPKDPISLLLAILNTIFLGHGQIAIFILYIISPVVLLVLAWQFVGSMGFKLNQRVFFCAVSFFNPIFWLSIYQGRFNVILSYVALMMLGFAIVRLFGISNNFRKFEVPFDAHKGSVMFAALSGFSLMFVCIGSPVLSIPLFVLSILFIKQIRLNFIILWLPTVFIFLPTRIHLLKNIKYFFADPGIPFLHDVFSNVKFSFNFFTVNNFNSIFLVIFFILPILILWILALIAALKKTIGVIAFFIAFLGLLTAISARYINLDGVIINSNSAILLCTVGLSIGTISYFNFLNKNVLKNSVIGILVTILFIADFYSIFNIVKNDNFIKKSDNYSKIIDVANNSAYALKTLVITPKNNFIDYQIMRSSDINIDDVSSLSYWVDYSYMDGMVAKLMNSDSTQLFNNGIGYISVEKNKYLQKFNVVSMIDRAENLHRITETSKYVLWGIPNQSKLYFDQENATTPLLVSAKLPIKSTLPNNTTSNSKLILAESYSKNWVLNINGQKITPVKNQWKTQFNLPANLQKGTNIEIYYQNNYQFLIILQLIVLLFLLILLIPIRKTGGKSY
jgi:hypothetical protein